MKRYLLGIDVGTSSLKAALLNEDCSIVAFASREYAISYPQENWVEIDAGLLWDTVLVCIRDLRQQQPLENVVGIGFSCMCPGVVALDEQFRPLLNPILYADRRSVEEDAWIKQTVGLDNIFRITANTVMAGAISATTMLWIKRNLPDVYEKTRCFGHINTMLCALLTGEVAIDPSNASYTALYETAADGTWSPMLCEQIGIDIQKLPPIREASEVCGRLICQELIDLGIPAGTPVVIGGADTACTAVACGAIRDGDMFESLGTTSVLTVSIDKPLFCREYINRRHVVAGQWLYQGAMSNVGIALNWCADELCKDLKQESETTDVSIYSLLDREAMASTAGADGILFLPYLTGERCPIWNPNARGVFFGIAATTQRKDLVRAVMESCCYGMRQLIEIAENLTGRTIEKINLVGGGARSSVRAQMKADITGKEIRVLAQKHSAVIGAAMLAGIGIGMFPSAEAATKKLNCVVDKVFVPQTDPNIKAIYNARYQSYIELYDRLKAMF